MQTCTLNGTWQLSAGHRSLESVDMQIPGTVLSGLLAAGKIKDPFYRTNEDATRALFWKDYVFTRTFDVDEELLLNNILFWCVKDLTHLRKSASTAHSLQKQIICTVPGNSRQRNFCTPEKTKFRLFFVLCCVLSKIILMKPIKKSIIFRAAP